MRRRVLLCHVQLSVAALLVATQSTPCPLSRFPAAHDSAGYEGLGKAASGPCRIDVEWGRGRLFDQDAAQLFQVLVKEARSMRCTGVTTKEERRPRPHGDTPRSHADSWLCDAHVPGLSRSSYGCVDRCNM